MNIHTISNNREPNDQGPSWSGSISDWWKRVPLFTRFILYTSIFFYITSWISLGFVLFFCNIPYYTLDEFHLWTLFTTVFINLDLLNLLFAFWSWLDLSAKLEIQSGTILYMLNFLAHNVLIQMLYLTIIYFLCFLYTPFYRQYSAGLWPLIMALITNECLKTPDGDSYFFCQIKNKYYPWVLFLLFLVFNQFVLQVDVLAGILFGYLDFYYIGKYIAISQKTALWLENSCMFSWMRSFTSISKNNPSIQQNNTIVLLPKFKQ